MRYLAIDLGDRRTGLALGDDVTCIATPLSLIDVPIERDGGGAVLSAIAKALEEHVGPGACELVLGLPLNMDGSESPRAKQARAFAERLAAATGRAVHLHDERRTSVLAEERLSRTGFTHKQKKARRDAIAAAAILAGFLAAHRDAEHAP